MTTKPEIIEKWRKEFEFWHLSKYGYLGCYEMSGIAYQRHDVESRWCTWKEARQSVKIEIPAEDFTGVFFLDAIIYYSALKNHIYDHGYLLEIKAAKDD